MSDYTAKGSKSFDPHFHAQILALAPFTNDSTRSKEEALEFCKEHGRRPSRSSKDPKERSLANRANGFTSPKSKTYDPHFRTAFYGAHPLAYNSKAKKAEIIQFCLDYQRRPLRSNGGEEKALAVAMGNFTSKSSRSFDPDFRSKLEELVPSKKSSPKP